MVTPRKKPRTKEKPARKKKRRPPPQQPSAQPGRALWDHYRTLAWWWG